MVGVLHYTFDRGSRIGGIMANFFTKDRWRNKRGLKCPHCGSTRIRKDGIPKRDKKQRYFCKKCRRHTIAPKGGKGGTRQ